MSISAENIAKYVVTKCTTECQPVTNIQLQKILYHTQLELLRQGLEPFEDEIEAWRFAPVVADVYYRFSHYGAKPIRHVFESIELSIEYTLIIDKVVESTRKLKTWDLVMDHNHTAGAWYRVFNGGIGDEKLISIEEIKKDL